MQFNNTSHSQKMLLNYVHFAHVKKYTVNIEKIARYKHRLILLTSTRKAKQNRPSF